MDLLAKSAEQAQDSGQPLKLPVVALPVPAGGGPLSPAEKLRSMEELAAKMATANAGMAASGHQGMAASGHQGSHQGSRPKSQSSSRSESFEVANPSPNPYW